MAMMISKFHKLIQSKVVWTVFAVLISVAFVGVYTGSQSGGPDERADPRPKVVGQLWGEDVSREEYGTAYHDMFVLTDLNYLLQTGRGMPETEGIMELMQQQAWTRVATLRKAESMGLKVTNEQTKQAIRAFPAFRNPNTGGFEKQMYDYMMANVFANRYGMRPADFERMIRRNTLIQKAAATASQGALVTEEEIKNAFHLYNDKITVQHAVLPRALADEVEMTDEIAKEYYLRNLQEFLVPEKRIVKAVAFNVADHTNSVVVTEEMIAQQYEANKQRFIKPETATNAVPEFQSVEDVTDELTADLTEALARQQAFNQADQLVAALANPGATFDAEVEKAGLTAKSIPPFTASGRVFGADPTAPIARAAFGLVKDDTHYYSDPVVGKDTVYVLSLQEIKAPFQLQFEAAKADAIESAKIAESEKAYVEKAESVHADIAAAVKGGATFADACAKYNLELTTSEPFSYADQLEGEFSQEIMGATIRYDAGSVTDLISTRDEFLVAYVTEKQVADEATELPPIRENLANGIRAEKARTLAQAWQSSLLDEAQFVDLTLESASDES